MTNGFSHSYHLDESTFFYRGVSSNLSFLFHFSMKIKIANGIAPDGTPRFAASHLGLFCLPMSHKKDARLIWVNNYKLSNRHVLAKSMMFAYGNNNKNSAEVYIAPAFGDITTACNVGQEKKGHGACLKSGQCKFSRLDAKY